MKWNKRASLIAGGLLLFLLGVLLGSAWSRPGPASGRTEDAQQPQGFDVPVQTVPGVAPEMLRADYWTGDAGDTLLFSPEEIAAFNRNNPPYVLYNSTETREKEKLFLYDLPETLRGDDVLSLLDPTFLERMRSGSVYVNGAAPDAAYWDALEANCAYGRVPAAVTPVYAVCVRRTVAQLLPTDDFASDNPGERYCSDFVSAEILPCAGVAVLHESADGAWKYVLIGSFCGWVHSDMLALCRDRGEWLAAIRPERYLVVTADELVLDETAVPTAQSGAILPMGTRLRLAEAPPAQVHGRSALGCYCVELPVARADGGLGWETALIGVTQDVHVGDLPMTSDNVVRQAFKLLGRVYGWGGSFRSNDCSGIVCQIYGCCGLELPRNGLAIAKLDDLGTTFTVKMSEERKLRLLSEMPAGTLLYMDEHLMLYLGMREGRPYVISSCGKYVEPGDAGGLRDGYCVFVSGLDLLRRSGKTWLEDLSYLLWKDY